jgi:adenylylsulfate kinase-like enzyme
MIIFISGAINSGKSTVAKLLQEKLGNTAVVEVDNLRSFIQWLPIEDAVPLNLKNTVSVIKNFVAEGMNVIVPYPLSLKNYEYLAEELKSVDTKIFFLTLAPSMAVALTQRGQRELDEWEKERIQYHYGIGIAAPKFGEVIDNSQQTPEETVDRILNLIGIEVFPS